MKPSQRISFEASDKAFKRLRPKKVLLQLPSGLKRRASEIAEEIRQRYGCRVIISGDSCYGACDVARAPLAVDAIVQMGHAPMRLPKSAVPIIFIPVFVDLNLERLIPTALSELKSPVGILSTAQHIHQVKEATRILRNYGFVALVSKGSGRLSTPGQILGCDYSPARRIANGVGSFLLLGGGRFHALGALLATGKPVVILDPERKRAIVERFDSDAFLRKRFAVSQALAAASKIGILVCSKPGQERQRLAEELSRISEEYGKKAEIIAIDEISPDKLEDLEFEAYVSTACPRIALDDCANYNRPIGTPSELMMALGRMRWDDYEIDDWSFSLRGIARRN